MLTAADIALASISIKIERAKKHLLDIQSLALNTKEGIMPIADGKSKRHRTVPVLYVPVDVITGAGDTIHNLRAAFDHLAWELAKWKTGVPKHPSFCCFPIGNTVDKYKAMRESRAVAGMSPEAKKAIDALLPYKGGNERLWMIHHLDIVDKYRHILITGYQILFSGTTLPGTFSTVQDEPAHFVGLFDDDFKGEKQRAIQPTSAELEFSYMKPLIPSLHELLVFTEELIQNFKPLLGLRR